jgi:hypothetical protein
MGPNTGVWDDALTINQDRCDGGWYNSYRHPWVGFSVPKLHEGFAGLV